MASPFVVIDDFDIIGVALPELETYAPGQGKWVVAAE
jgi:hypothetical protein